MAINREYDSAGVADKREAKDRARQKLFTIVYDSIRPRVMALVRKGDHDGAWNLLCDGPDVEGGKETYIDGQRVKLSAVDRVDISRRLHDTAKMHGFDDAARVRVGAMITRIIRETNWTAGRMVAG
jgi:hypothetical protein